MTLRWRDFIVFQGLLSLAIPSFGKDIYLLTHQNKSVEIPLETHQGLLVNDVCKNNPATCEALKVFKSKPSKLKQTNNRVSHRASDYCKVVKGVSLDLTKSSGEGQSFCAFSDHSIISSWQLFNAHFPDKTKK